MYQDGYYYSMDDYMEQEEEWEREGLLDPAWEKQQKKVSEQPPCTFSIFSLLNRLDYLLHLRLNKKLEKCQCITLFSLIVLGCEVCIAMLCICVCDTFEIVSVKLQKSIAVVVPHRII